MADNVIVRVPEQQFIRGEDGYSPEVTIEDIAHGHSVTITDRDHPEGQSFNVMDGDSAYEQAVAGGYEGTEAEFNEELRSFKTLSEQATGSAAAAAQSESNAAGSATTATTKAQEAADSAAQALIRMNSAATSAQRASRDADRAGANADAAGRSASAASGSASDAATAKAAAEEAAEDAEAYAVGKRGGTDVGSSDPAYHNNAKYYAEQASGSATDASGSATSAESSATAAGNAQTAAETAQEAAEDAQAAAEAVLESIPSDYTDLTEDVSDLKSALTLYTGNAQINFVRDKYIVTSGNTVDITSPIDSSTGYGYAVIDCTDGDKFTVTASGGQNPRAWCFIDASGNSLSKAGANVAVNNVVITAPANSAKLVINAKYATEKSYYGEFLANRLEDLNNAFDGYCNLDFSDIVDAYLSTTTIGGTVNFASSTATKTIKKITQVKRGYIYRISVTEGDTLATTSGRGVLVLTDSEGIIFQNDIYFLTAGQTDTIEFTAFGNGYLYLQVDNNYRSISIEGSSVFQAQKVSENADYKVTYLAETGRLIVIRESIRAYRYATKHFDLPAGTYHFHCDSVVSTDTDSTVCLVNLGGGSAAFNVSRGVAIDVDVVLPNNSSTQYFYSSDGSSHSNGDRVAYNNVIISKAAYSPIDNALIDENSAWSD